MFAEVSPVFVFRVHSGDSALCRRTGHHSRASLGGRSDLGPVHHAGADDGSARPTHCESGCTCVTVRSS